MRLLDHFLNPAKIVGVDGVSFDGREGDERRVKGGNLQGVPSISEYLICWDEISIQRADII